MSNPMTTHKFQATLERPDMKGTWTYITVPFSVEDAFGSKARLPVRAGVNNVEFRSSLLPQGSGVHILVVNKHIREQAGMDAGDSACVEIGLDTEQRVVELPDELRDALDADGKAQCAFDALSYSHKKEYADYISEAKRPQTRERRAARSVQMLTEGKRLKS